MALDKIKVACDIYITHTFLVFFSVLTHDSCLRSGDKSNMIFGLKTE